MTLNEDGHRQAVTELQGTRARLALPDDIRVYAEVGFGIALHLLAVGAQRRHAVHRDDHQGLGRWLRQRGHDRQAEALAELESTRLGRWYGRQGNGDAAKRIDELLAELEAWALA